MGGFPGAFKRRNQLTTNSTRIRKLPAPCNQLTDLARVPDGIASASIVPTIAAIRPLITPAAIIQKANPDQYPLPVTQWMISKTADVVSSPSGKLTSMG